MTAWARLRDESATRCPVKNTTPTLFKLCGPLTAFETTQSVSAQFYNQIFFTLFEHESDSQFKCLLILPTIWICCLEQVWLNLSNTCVLQMARLDFRSKLYCIIFAPVVVFISKCRLLGRMILRLLQVQVGHLTTLSHIQAWVNSRFTLLFKTT